MCAGVSLQPGEIARLSFNITPEDLKYYKSDLVYDWDAGDFIIHIGTDSSNFRSTTVHWAKE